MIAGLTIGLIFILTFIGCNGKLDGNLKAGAFVVLGIIALLVLVCSYLF